MAMASLTLSSLHLRPPLPSSSSSSARASLTSLHPVSFANPTTAKSLRLSWSHSISGFPSLVASQKRCSVSSLSQKLRTLTIVAAKGYKMKTHKASAKRFRVTGRGKIVRRRAGKQHLLQKKNTKRRVRLSKMVGVSKSDYDNVIGALPYLKVNRAAK